MVGGDHVDGAVPQALQQRLAIRAVTQRRVHLEAPVLLQAGVVQQQVVRAGLAAHVHAGGLRVPDQLHALLGGDVADVVAAAGLRRQLQVALDGPPLGFGADAPVSVGACVRAVVDVAAAQQAVVLAVGRDQLAQRPRALHGLAHHARILHAAPVVAEGAHPRRKALQVGKLLALFAHADRAVGQHADHRVPTDNVQLGLKVRNAVRHRIQVRHGAHRGAAAPRRRPTAASNRLLVRKTRLPEVHMHVRETGKHVL